MWVNILYMDPMGKGVSCGENVGNFQPSGVWLYFCLRTTIPQVMKQPRMQFGWCLTEDFHRHEAVKQWGTIQCMCFISSGPVLVKPALSGYISHLREKGASPFFHVLVIRYRPSGQTKCIADQLPRYSSQQFLAFFFGDDTIPRLKNRPSGQRWMESALASGKSEVSRVYGLMDKQ